MREKQNNTRKFTPTREQPAATAHYGSCEWTKITSGTQTRKENQDPWGAAKEASVVVTSAGCHLENTLPKNLPFLTSLVLNPLENPPALQASRHHQSRQSPLPQLHLS